MRSSASRVSRGCHNSSRTTPRTAANRPARVQPNAAVQSHYLGSAAWHPTDGDKPQQPPQSCLRSRRPQFRILPGHWSFRNSRPVFGQHASIACPRRALRNRAVWCQQTSAARLFTARAVRCRNHRRTLTPISGRRRQATRPSHRGPGMANRSRAHRTNWPSATSGRNTGRREPAHLRCPRKSGRCDRTARRAQRRAPSAAPSVQT